MPNDDERPPTWVERTRTLRWGVAVGFVVLVTVVAFTSDALRVCGDSVVAFDDSETFEITRVCRTPTVTDVHVLVSALLLALLLLPEAQLGFGGFTLKRQIDQAERQIESLDHRISSVAGAASSSRAINTTQVVFGPGSTAQRLDDQELFVWVDQLVRVEFRRARRNISTGILAADELADVTPDDIALKVYLFNRDGSLAPVIDSHRRKPDRSAVAIFDAGTGAVGLAARTEQFYLVVGIDEVLDHSDRFRLRPDQREVMAQRRRRGTEAPVTAAAPLMSTETGQAIGALSVDLRLDGLDAPPGSPVRDVLDQAIRRALIGASGEISAVLVRLGGVR